MSYFKSKKQRIITIVAIILTVILATAGILYMILKDSEPLPAPSITDGNTNTPPDNSEDTNPPDASSPSDDNNKNHVWFD